MRKYFPQIIALLFIVGFAAYAWTEPTQAPPAGNVATPINVGDVAQTKTGDFSISRLVSGFYEGLFSADKLNIRGGVILNTGGAENGLIIDKGKICIGTDCRSAWPAYQYPPQSCAAGSSIRVINSDGSVVCEPNTDTIGTLACTLRPSSGSISCNNICSNNGETCVFMAAANGAIVSCANAIFSQNCICCKVQ